MTKGRPKTLENKVHNIAKLHKRVPTGLICAYNASQSGPYEELKWFDLEMAVDEHQIFVLQHEPTLFLYDSERSLLYGVFQATGFEVVDSYAKIVVQKREERPALGGAELRKAASQFRLALNKFPEIIDTSQVSGLTKVFRDMQRIPRAPPPFDESECLYSEQPRYCSVVAEYENMNQVDECPGYAPRQYDAAPRISMALEPVPMSFGAPAMESRIISTGMKPVLCGAPEQYGATYAHPVASQRGGDANGFGYPPPAPRQAQAPGAPPYQAPVAAYQAASAPYNNTTSIAFSDGVYPVPLGNEIVPGEFVQPGYKQTFPIAREVREVREFSPAAAPKKKSSPMIQRVQGTPRIERVQGTETKLLKLFTKSYVKRNGSELDFESHTPTQKQTQKPKQFHYGNQNSGSVFTRVNKQHLKRDSVFKRLDDPESDQNHHHHQKNLQHQKQKPQQMPEQKPQQMPEQKLQQMPGRKVSLVINEQTRPVKRFIENPKPVEEKNLPEDNKLVEQVSEQEKFFIDFKRRSSNRPGSSSSSPVGDTNSPQEQGPKVKKRRFTRPEGLGTSRAFDEAAPKLPDGIISSSEA